MSRDADEVRAAREERGKRDRLEIRVEALGVLDAGSVARADEGDGVGGRRGGHAGTAEKQDREQETDQVAHGCLLCGVVRGSGVSSGQCQLLVALEEAPPGGRRWAGFEGG